MDPNTPTPGIHFIGHKRRVTCKVCASGAAASETPDEAEAAITKADRCCNHAGAMKTLAPLVRDLQSRLRVAEAEKDKANSERSRYRADVETAFNKTESLHKEGRELRQRITSMEGTIKRLTEHHEWSRKLPDEQQMWWWWNEDEDSSPIAVHIAYSGTDGTYFATEGQYGWTRFQPVAEMGGWWMRVDEPQAPSPQQDASGAQEAQ